MQPAIRYTIVPCTLGRLLLAATRRGVCAVFLGDGDRELLDFLKAEFPRRAFTQDADGLRTWASAVAHLVEGKTPRCKVPTDVDATPFQQRVWQQLCKIPRGHTRSYREIAQALGQPDAARAVARACATNPVSLLVPCHRVVRADGGISGYRWGVHRKRAILDVEAKS